MVISMVILILSNKNFELFNPYQHQTITVNDSRYKKNG